MTHTGSGRKVEFTPDSVSIYDMQTNLKIASGKVNDQSRLYTFSDFVPQTSVRPPVVEHRDQTSAQKWRSMSDIFDNPASIPLLEENPQALLTMKPSMSMHAYIMHGSDPQNYAEANGHPEWEAAMHEEDSSLIENETWDLVPFDEEEGAAKAYDQEAPPKRVLNPAEPKKILSSEGGSYYAWASSDLCMLAEAKVGAANIGSQINGQSSGSERRKLAEDNNGNAERAGKGGEVTTPSRRGRPKGSKNKPKALLPGTRESPNTLKCLAFEIPSGEDMWTTLETFARRRQQGLFILSGNGMVRNVVLPNPAVPTGVVMCRGPFHIVSITGAFPRASENQEATGITVSLQLLEGIYQNPLYLPKAQEIMHKPEKGFIRPVLQRSRQISARDRRKARRLYWKIGVLERKVERSMHVLILNHFVQNWQSRALSEVNFVGNSGFLNNRQSDAYSHTLYLPRMTVAPLQIEVLLCNLAALEFVEKKRCTTLTSFLRLMGNFIKTPDDVQTLKKSEVAIAVILGVNFGGTGEGSLSKGFSILIVLLICVYVMAFDWSWGPVAVLVPSEIFPMEIRSAGQSITVTVGLFFTFVIAQAFLAMLCHMKYGLFHFFAGGVAVMTAFVYWLLPETKNVPIEEMGIVWKQHWYWKRFVEDNGTSKIAAAEKVP